MELKHLRTFVVTAGQLSFTQAARELGLTQAAVSQHIAALERAVDGRLFDRAGRRVVLTDRGRRLHHYAQQILSLVDEAARDARAGDELTGTLLIAASTVPAEWLLPELLARFRCRHPGIREHISITDSDGAARAVETGEAEIGLVGELPKSRRVDARALADDELVLVAGPEHRWRSGKPVTLRQLRGEPLIVREPGSGSRHCVESGLAAQGLRLDDLTVVMEMNSNDAIRAAVQRNAGVAFLSVNATAGELAAGRLVRVPVRGLRLKRRLYVIKRRDRPDSPAAQAFLEFLQDS